MPGHTMAKPSHIHARLPLRFAIFLLLSAAVFGWGLHYKLSLYHATEVRALSAPAAKLLSPRERTQVGEATPAPGTDDQTRYRAFLPLALSFVVLSGWLSLRFAVLRIGGIRTYLAPARRVRLHIVFLFFRPPPAMPHAR